MIELKGEYDSFLRQEVSDGLAFCLMRNHHCCWNTRVATGISSSSLPLQLSPILVCSPLSRSFNLVVIGLFLPGGSIIIMIILCALLPIQLFLSSLTTHRIAYQQTTQQQQHHNIILYSDMVTSIASALPLMITLIAPRISKSKDGDVQESILACPNSDHLNNCRRD